MVKLRIEVIRPAGGVLTKVEGEGQLGETGTAEIQFGLRNLALPDFGIYAFNVYVNDDLKMPPVGITVSRPPAPIAPTQP